MKIHTVDSWVITSDVFPCSVVYTEQASRTFREGEPGRNVQYEQRHRVCVLNRADAECDTCYMCDREEVTL